MSDIESTERCLGCGEKLWIAGYLRQAGKPKMYTTTYYCDNFTCLRYGLVTFYKARKS